MRRTHKFESQPPIIRLVPFSSTSLYTLAARLPRKNRPPLSDRGTFIKFEGRPVLNYYSGRVFRGEPKNFAENGFFYT